ncbi:hypothetical protein N8K70_11025 [Microbacterium betulae]|uniref:Uncharacterized protein n=1 Tax=Microbacterium betulae TaxID=2981139 RepID=A0AA97I5V4_9MICO|nr:hypothetical protein [Microbacterium sp. AB]WOF21915.1 hypothetical protein N8K70_11025 [Microbacterium sp. AB]
MPNKVYSRLIVRYPYQTNRDYALSYRFAAKRLAETFTGDTIDDLILLPFLTLYRQAFELELKNLIQFLVSTRMTYVEGRTSELEQARSDERFKELGHNLHKLLNEAKKHYDALDLDESFPPEVEKLIAMLHEADKSGTAFRYAGQLPNTQEHADFPDLAALLEQQYDNLTVITDYVDGLYSAGPTLNELAGDYY